MDNFLDEIYIWYKDNKRDLPWRQTSDPYKIWLSEIILQQTRVAQGTDYYLRFTGRFPAIKYLAEADEDEVLKLWQGLGYYSRARNLHEASKYIQVELKGKFPSTYGEIKKLKGVGDYTAAAIASIAFNLPFPVVDGNIYRFFSRYFGIATPIDSSKGKKEIYQVASELMSPKIPGFHNQALMEFGALQCVPKSPRCEICPVWENCFAARNNLVGCFPVKAKKNNQKERFFYYYIIETGGTLFLEKRTASDIWKNLYQFPLFESSEKLSGEELLNQNSLPFIRNCIFNIKSVSSEKKHVLSHQVIFARVIHVEVKNKACLSGNFIQVNKKDITKFAVPRLLENFINELDFFQN